MFWMLHVVPLSHECRSSIGFNFPLVAPRKALDVSCVATTKHEYCSYMGIVVRVLICCCGQWFTSTLWFQNNKRLASLWCHWLLDQSDVFECRSAVAVLSNRHAMQSTPLISNGRNLEDESQKIDVCTLFRVSLLLDITSGTYLYILFRGVLNSSRKKCGGMFVPPYFPAKNEVPFLLENWWVWQWIPLL